MRVGACKDIPGEQVIEKHGRHLPSKGSEVSEPETKGQDERESSPEMEVSPLNFFVSPLL